MPTSPTMRPPTGQELAALHQLGLLQHVVLEWRAALEADPKPANSAKSDALSAVTPIQLAML